MQFGDCWCICSSQKNQIREFRPIIITQRLARVVTVFLECAERTIALAQKLRLGLASVGSVRNQKDRTRVSIIEVSLCMQLYERRAGRQDILQRQNQLRSFDGFPVPLLLDLLRRKSASTARRSIGASVRDRKM